MTDADVTVGEVSAVPGDAVPPTPGDAPLQLVLPLDAFRELLLAAHPDIVPELVQGTTYEELQASLPVAKAAYARIAEQARGQRAPVEPVPAGAAVRSPAINAERLSPAEKIRAGLRK